MKRLLGVGETSPCSVLAPRGRRRGWAWAAGLVICLLVLELIGWTIGGVPVSQAASSSQQVDELRRQIEQHQQRMKRLESEQQRTARELQRIQRQQRSVEQELHRLDLELTRTRQELAYTEERLADAEKRLALAEAELEEAERRLASRTDLLGRRLRAIAEHGTVAYLDVLLAARTFEDFLTRFDLLQQIVEQDVALLKQVRADRAAVEAKKKQVEAEREQIVALKMQLLERQQAIEVVAAQHQDAYEQLQQDEAEYRRSLAELEQASKEVQNLLRKLTAELSRLLPGEAGPFVWPVDRSGYWRISSPFGRRWHPVIREYRMHDGVDIAKPHGSNIYAAAAGQVVYAGWLGGYGNTVIIAHSSTLSTLYGHASKLLVRVGDRVSAGQRIALVGSTGMSTGPHLHFEVRKNGTPVDPMPYLP